MASQRPAPILVWGGKALISLKQTFSGHMQSWLPAPISLVFYLLRRTEVGKRIARRLSISRFYGHRAIYNQSEQLREFSIGVSCVRWLINEVTPQAIYSVFAVCIFGLLPLWFQRNIPSSGWLFSGIPNFKPEASYSLLSTIAQASAAILAIFFTAVSVVVSTTYLKVRPEIRSLVIIDDLNSLYIRLLSHTAVTSLAGLALIGMDIPASYPLLGYTLLLMACCLLGFFAIGSRVFHLFDPAALAPLLANSFARNMTLATNKGRTWLDPSFQSHAVHQANIQLRSLEDLVTEVVRDDHPRNDQTLLLASTVANLAVFHATEKLHIPSESLWFPRRNEFKAWYASNSSSISIAIETGTVPSSEQVPDPRQMESRCITMLGRCLDRLINRQAWNEVPAILQIIANTVDSFSRSFELESADELLLVTRNTILDALLHENAPKNSLKILQITDLCCYSAIASILHPALELSEKPDEMLDRTVTDISSLKKRLLYRQGHPRAVKLDLEDLSKRLFFEKDVEGIIQSPEWFIRKIVLINYTNYIRDRISAIPILVKNAFNDPITRLIENKKSLSASIWLQRGMEACVKGDQQIQALGNLHAHFINQIKLAKNTPESGVIPAREAIESTRQGLVQAWGKLVPDLCESKESQNLPDILGQARALIGDELVRIICNKQESVFPNLVLAYWNASQSILQGIVAQTHGEASLKFLPQVVDLQLDLMELSGIAIILSDIDKTQFGKMVSALWDILLSRAQDPTALAKAWLASIDSNLSVPFLSPSSMQRSRWGDRLRKALLDRGIEEEEIHGFSPFISQKTDEKSPLIRALGYHLGHSYREPYQFFGALYIAKLEVAKSLELPYSVSSLLRELEEDEEP